MKIAKYFSNSAMLLLLGDGAVDSSVLIAVVPGKKKNEFMFSERREKGFHCKNQNVNNVKSVFTNKSK